MGGGQKIQVLSLAGKAHLPRLIAEVLTLQMPMASGSSATARRAPAKIKPATRPNQGRHLCYFFNL